jgi:hypothetical protein
MRRSVAAIAGLAFGALALAGCEDMQPGGPGPTVGGYYPQPPPPPPRPQEGFSPQEFAWSEGAGAGVLGGRVAYHSVSGERWTCAGQTIALIPATRYSAERMRVLYGSDGRAVVPAAEVQNRNAAHPGVDYGRYVHTATCDAHDAFRFAAVQPGPYFLIARARPKSHAPGPTEGVVIMQRVDIAPGPTRIVVPQP